MEKVERHTEESFAFAFVCQAGDLEIQSLYLVASLKECLIGNYELYAVIPTVKGILELPNDETIALLESWGVSAYYVENEILSKHLNISKEKLRRNHYITNKHYALTIPTKADKIVFIDTDVILLKKLRCMEFFHNSFMMQRVGRHGAQGHDYKNIFKEAGVPYPSETWEIKPKKPGEHVIYTPPHFNSFLICIERKFARELHETWTNYWLKLFFALPVITHIGQLALMVSVHHLKAKYVLFKDIPEYFFHYHNTERILNPTDHIDTINHIHAIYPELRSARQNLIREKNVKSKFKSGFSTIQSFFKGANTQR